MTITAEIMKWTEFPSGSPNRRCRNSPLSFSFYRSVLSDSNPFSTFMQWVICDASPILTVDNSSGQFTNTAVTSFRFAKKKIAMYWCGTWIGHCALAMPTRHKIPNFRFFFFRYNFFWHLAAVAAVDTGGGVDSHSTKLYSICLHRRTLSALLHIVMSLFANFFFAQMKEEWEIRKREEEKQTVSLYYESGGVHASSDML